MSARRVKVTVHEQIIEDTVIEIEVPADIDLDDDVVRMEFLERIWCGGEYKKLDLESQLQITDRDFSEPEVLA